MGWWNTNPVAAADIEFAATTDDHLWGDGPADIMDTALDEIRERFRMSMGREPLMSEILAGVKFCTCGFSEFPEFIVSDVEDAPR